MELTIAVGFEVLYLRWELEVCGGKKNGREERA